MKLRTAEKRPKRMTNRHPKAEEGVDVFLLWSTGHFDGPCSGICLYQGQRCAFRLVVWPGQQPRICAIVEMTEEQFSYEENRQKIFADMLGPHTYFLPYTPEGKRQRHPPRTPYVRIPQEVVSKCYEIRGKEADLSENKVLAWMEL